MKQMSPFILFFSYFVWACVGTDIIEDINIVPARIVISPNISAVQVSEMQPFQADYYDTLGNLVDEAIFQWNSSNSAIASVDDDGVATGLTTGQVMITATVSGVTSEAALLTVVADPNQVARVEVEPDSGSIQPGETLQFTAAAFNLDGDPITGKTFNWSSSNSNVATIDGNGLATGLTGGNAEIVAETDGVSSAPAKLTVLGNSRSGMFMRNPNTSYQVIGTATLEQRLDGSLVLHLGADYSSSNGPGLHVFLSSISGVNSQSRDLGDLKSASGAQSYEVASGVNLNTFDWVVIHCVPFNVSFGYARLQ